MVYYSISAFATDIQKTIDPILTEYSVYVLKDKNLSDEEKDIRLETVKAATDLTNEGKKKD